MFCTTGGPEMASRKVEKLLVQYLDVIDRLGLSAAALELAFHHLVFDVAAVTGDDHHQEPLVLVRCGWDLVIGAGT